MNTITRGIKNTIRSPLRSVAIILMLAISIGLILSMLVARNSVNSKIDELKSNTGTNITVSPAGVMGFSGGGDPLTSTQISTIKNTAHISSVTETLSDQLGTDDTDLESSLELGSFGQRQMRFESSSSTDTDSSSSSDSTSSSATEDSSRPTPTPRITVTGTTDPTTLSSNGGSTTVTVKSGKTFASDSTDLVAVIGSALATKNNLSVGDTFTAYSKTITVIGIYTTDNTFQNSSIIMPLATLQTLTDQSGDVSSVVVKVDSTENVSSVVTSLKSSLGTKADVTSEAEMAEQSVSSLKGIASLALAGVIGSAIAGAVIILLAMIMIVRERRREIGVIKAIGGSNRKVVTQFVSEAMTITIFGTIIGLVLGILVAGPMTTSLVSSQSSTTSSQTQQTGPGGAMGMMKGGMDQIKNNFTQVTSSLTPQVFVSAIGITLLISIIGSAIPAWFIARIKPAEVLRSE